MLLDRLVDKLEDITFKEAEEDNSKRENANVDGNTSMGLMLLYGQEGAKAVSEKIIKPEHLEAHNKGEIHIHDRDFYSTGTLTCCQIDINKLFKDGFFTGHGHLREPNSIGSYAALTAIAIQSNQNDQHGGQAIPAFDSYLKKGVVKSFRKNIKRNLLNFLNARFILSKKENVGIIEKELDKIIERINSIELEDKIKKDLTDLIFSYIQTTKERLTDEEMFKLSCIIYDEIYDESIENTDRETYQAMEGFIHNLNTMNSRAGSQVPFSSINFGTDTSEEGRMVIKNLLLAQEAGLGNGETAIFPITIFKVKEGVNYNPKDPNYDLFKLAMRVSSKRLFPNFAFLDAPFNLKFYKEGDVDTEIAYMGCRTRTIANVNGENVVTGRGNLSFTSINLPRIAIKYKSLDLFFEELNRLMDLVIEQLIERFYFQAKKKVKNFPFLMGQGVWRGSEKLDKEDYVGEVIKEGSLSVGFIGLAEALIALTGKHHGESRESQELGLEIISFMNNKLKRASEKYKMNFALIATPAEGLSERFVAIDKRKYGIIEGVTDKDYYTNSFHVPVYFKLNAIDKIKIEAPYHELTAGGHISYIEVDGDVSKNIEAFETIVRAMKEEGIGYGSINHPIDRDDVCGYTGVINGNICPKCGREEGDVPFKRIRRITGYLVGSLERFNDGKKAEEHDRVKHL